MKAIFLALFGCAACVIAAPAAKRQQKTPPRNEPGRSRCFTANRDGGTHHVEIPCP